MINKLRTWKPSRDIFAYGFFAVWIAFVFRHLITRISTAFIDWGDTPFIAWQIFITRDKLLSLNFAQLPHTNTHYPYQWSLFFTDTFLGQALMAVPLFFIKNPVLLYNLVFLLTVFINYLAAYHLFRFIFKSRWGGFLGSIFLNNSIFFYDQRIHLQMISYWPLLYAFYFLLRLLTSEKKHIRDSLCAGILLSVQFYMSVYLGIFGAFSFLLFALVFATALTLSKKPLLGAFKTFFIHTFTMALAFILCSYPIIFGYLLFEKLHHKTRDINEILINSTHITDFLFFTPGTLFSSLSVVQKFNSLNKHFASEMIRFPGFVLLIGATLGLLIQKVRVKLKEQKIEITNMFTLVDVFFLLLILVGFIFSLGPRLNGNGRYLEIPLPYLIFLNKITFLHSIRVTHRWIILFIIALVYLSTKFYSRIQKKYIVFVMLLFIVESVVISISATEQPYIDAGHRYLKKTAPANKVLLEYPFMNLEKGAGMSYATRMTLASTYHALPLVNGYTGLFIQDYGGLRLTLEKRFPDSLTDSLIRALGVNYLKINTAYIDASTLKKITSFYSRSIVYKTPEHLVIRLTPLSDMAQDSQVTVKFRAPRAIDYGDGKMFINMFYRNTTRYYFANTDQKKITLHIKFFNRKKLVYTKELYDLYPLQLSPFEQKPVVIDFYVRKKFDEVVVKALPASGQKESSQRVTF